MFLNKYFLFYLPLINKYKIIKAKDESQAVQKLLQRYRLKKYEVENYQILKNFDIIK